MSTAATLAFAQAVIVMTLLGFLLIELVLPPKALSRGVVWAFAPAVGAGICSLIFFMFRRPMFSVEIGLLLFLLCLWIWKRGRRLPPLAQIMAWRMSIPGVLLTATVVLVLTQSAESIKQMPHGDTDGYAIWNSHARYLYRDGQSWQQHIQNTFHPDYPLLVPTLVARVWRYAEQDPPEMGGFAGILFPFIAIAVLGATIGQVRGSSAGVFVALTLLTTSYYIVLGTHQEADVPLSLFILCTVALIYLYFEREPPRKGVLVLAGFMAGCAAWTKNEGILFLVATSVALMVPLLWKPRVTARRITLFFAGLMLPLAVLIYFKFAIAPRNDLFHERHYADLAEKVLTLDRHAITFGSFLETAWTFGRWSIHPVIPLLAFLVWRGFDRNELRSPGWRTTAGILAIVMIGYYWVYILTPIELAVHLESSLNRLMIHVWPSLILLIGLTADKKLELVE